MNKLVIISELIISMASIIFLVKNYRKEGLYIWLVIAIIVSNIMINKTITISSVDINLGIIIIATIFIVTNLAIQKEGEKESNNIILIASITSICSQLIYILVSLTSISRITPTMDNSFNNLILNNLILWFSNYISLIIALKINSYIYYKIKILENKLWISNIISMISSQLIYGTLFGTMYLSYHNTYFNLIIITIIRFLIAITTQLLGVGVIYYLNKNDKNKGV